MGTDEGFEPLMPSKAIPAGLQTGDRLLDPYPWYAEMRETAPLQYDADRDLWMAFRYDVVEALLEWDADEVSAKQVMAPPGSPLAPMNDWIVKSDPPKHTKLREPVGEFFLPARIREHRPRIEEITEELLDEALDCNDGEFDFIQDFAKKVPTTIIADILGFPREEWAQLREWSEMYLAPPGTEDSGVSQEERARATGAWLQHIRQHVAKRTDDPDAYDDLTARLVEMEYEGEAFSESEIVGTAQLLALAGNVTTVALLGNTLRTFEEEGLHDAALADDLPLASTFEELSRYRSSQQHTERRTLTEIELAGKTIPEDTWIELWIGSANRDPRQFDEPDTFDVERSPNNHLAFGRGFHRCLGESLARLEWEVVFSTFYDRVENVDVDVDAMRPMPSKGDHGLMSLPVSVSM